MLAVSIRKELPGFTPDVGWAASEPIVALVGPSGSGKTLTLQARAGLVRPDARRIELDGRPLLDTGTGVDVPARRVVTIFVAYLVLAAAVGAGMARLLRLGPARLARSSSAPGPGTRSSSCRSRGPCPPVGRRRWRSSCSSRSQRCSACSYIYGGAAFDPGWVSS